MAKTLLVAVMCDVSDEYATYSPNAAVITLDEEKAKKILGLRKRLKEIAEFEPSVFVVKAHDTEPDFFYNLELQNDEYDIVEKLPDDDDVLCFDEQSDTCALEIHHDYFFWECHFDKIDNGLAVTTRGLSYDILQELL